jgi:hypothetical protein
MNNYSNASIKKKNSRYPIAISAHYLAAALELLEFVLAKLPHESGAIYGVRTLR